MKTQLALRGKRKLKPRGKPFPAGNKVGHRFKQGEVGNPTGENGRPYTEAHRLVAELPTSELKPVKSDPVALNVAKAIAIKALSGDVRAAAEARESIEGRATQRHELTGADGGAVKIDLETVVDKMCEFFGVSEALEAIPDQPTKK